MVFLYRKMDFLDGAFSPLSFFKYRMELPESGDSGKRTESRYTYVCTDTIHKFYVHFNMELFPGTDLFTKVY